MSRLAIVGMGPGHPDYLLPLAVSTIEEAEVLIGGRRHLEAYADCGKILIPLSGKYEPLIRKTMAEHEGKRIALLVSGDPGYHSPLRLISTFLDTEAYEVIPGLSSFQYLFTRIGRPWQGCRLISMHGRDHSQWEELLSEGPVALLLDAKTTPKRVSDYLSGHGQGEREVVIGYDLSYAYESIRTLRAEELEEEEYRLCVMILL